MTPCYTYTMPTKNVTLSIPVELLRRARVLAAQRDTSVSSLVAELLGQLTGEVVDYDEMWAEEERLMDAGLEMRIGPITWSREELHAR